MTRPTSSPSSGAPFDTRIRQWRQAVVASLRRQIRLTRDLGDNAVDDVGDDAADETGEGAVASALLERIVRRPTTSDAQALRELFDQQPPLALVRFDTPGIQSYLFRVMRPIDIEGGSRLVEEFIEQGDPSGQAPGAEAEQGEKTYSVSPKLRKKFDLQSGHLIYGGGGGGLILTTAKEAPEVVAVLENELEEKLCGDLLTVAASLPIWPWDLEAKDLDGEDLDGEDLDGEDLDGEDLDGEDLDRECLDTNSSDEPARGPTSIPQSPYSRALTALDIGLNDRRSTRPRNFGSLPSERVGQRCEACARRLGEVERSELGQDIRLCGGCDVRRRVGYEKKRELHQSRSYEVLVDGLGDPGIAVIYADGANVGDAFRRITNPTQHSALSHAVSAAMRAARECALEAAGALAPWLNEPLRRHQTPLIGGDDLILILPAALAPDVVVPMARAFEQHFDLASHGHERLEGENAGSDRPETRQIVEELERALADAPELRQIVARFGLGIGFAVADWMFPVQFTLGYAKALLRSAKGLLRGPWVEGAPRSAVDFMVLRNAAPLSEDLPALRQKFFEIDPDGRGDRLHLTQRPYTLPAFEEVLAHADALARVPASQRHAIRRELPLGLARSSSLWRYQHARSAATRSDTAPRGAPQDSTDPAGDLTKTAGPGADTDASPGSWAGYRRRLGRSLPEVDELLWQRVEASAPGDGSTYATDFLDALDLVHLRERREAIDAEWQRSNAADLGRRVS